MDHNFNKKKVSILDQSIHPSMPKASFLIVCEVWAGNCGYYFHAKIVIPFLLIDLLIMSMTL